MARTIMGTGSPSGPAQNPSRPGRIFVPVIFAIGFVLVGIVGFLGLGGHLQTTIPGNATAPPVVPVPLTACQGHATAGSFHFLIVAGLKGGFTFNGSSPGPCFAVAAGSSVSVTLVVSDQTNQFFGWVLINATGPTDQEPAFPNSGESGAARFAGIAPGQNVTFSFTVGSPGQYRYVSEVSHDASVGMWGGFNVTAPGTSTSGALVTAGSMSSSASGPVPPAARARFGP